MKPLQILIPASVLMSVTVLAQINIPQGNSPSTAPKLPNFQMPKWTPFEYWVTEVRDPTQVPSAGIPSISQPSRPQQTPLEYGNERFQQLCNEMGQQGWELVELMPRLEGGRTVSARAVFRREARGIALKPR